MKWMATFIVTATLFIGPYKVARANYVQVRSSMTTLNDTATVKLPLMNAALRGNGTRESLADKFKYGDPITIYLGYDGVAEYKEFTGFVTDVVKEIPLRLECEDATHLLRRTNLETELVDTTLKKVVQYIVDQTNLENLEYPITLSGKIPDIKMEKFRMNNINAAEAIQKIKDSYGLVAYFREFELYVGLAYTDDQGEVILSLAGNTDDKNCSLRKVKSDDKNIKIKATAILPDNKTIVIEEPKDKKGGSIRSKFYYGITNEADLRKAAKEELKKQRFNGLDGDLKSFLIPQIKHGMTIKLEDPLYEVVGGSYVAEEVVTSMDKGIVRVTKPKIDISDVAAN